MQNDLIGMYGLGQQAVPALNGAANAAPIHRHAVTSLRTRATPSPARNLSLFRMLVTFVRGHWSRLPKYTA
jgi:hypothetical protein